MEGQKRAALKTPRFITKDFFYLQVSEREAVPASGVLQLQLGSEAQMT